MTGIPWLSDDLEPSDILAELCAEVLVREPYTDEDAAQVERLVLRMRRGEDGWLKEEPST